MSIRKVFESQALLITANVLSGIISLVVIGLIADNLVYVHKPGVENGVTRMHYNNTISGKTTLEQANITVLPQNLRMGSYWALLAAGIGGFLDSLLLGGLLCWRRLKAAELQVDDDSVVRFNTSMCDQALLTTIWFAEHRSEP
jgi:hypothetical protein